MSGSFALILENFEKKLVSRISNDFQFSVISATVLVTIFQKGNNTFFFFEFCLIGLKEIRKRVLKYVNERTIRFSSIIFKYLPSKCPMELVMDRYTK